LFRKLQRGKIHGAAVTGADLHYEGSIAIDTDLLAAAGITPFESVYVWNVNNGERFETYAILNPAGSREVLVNGAAARRAQVGDRVIVAVFGWLAETELTSHTPAILLMGSANRIITDERDTNPKVIPAEPTLSQETCRAPNKNGSPGLF
jgi:aspartate 1-decarboxylase